MPGETFDRGILVGQSRRQFPSQPLGEFTGQGYGLRCPKPVTGEGLPDIDLAWLDPQPPLTPM